MKSQFTIFALLLVVVLSLTGCGGEKTPAQPLAIQGLDIRFDLNSLTAKAGQPIELTYENKGSIDHAFKIDGMVPETKIRSGATHVFKFTMKEPGEYQFVCAIPGHEMAGMVGVLKIQ